MKSTVLTFSSLIAILACVPITAESRTLSDVMKSLQSVGVDCHVVENGDIMAKVPSLPTVRPVFISSGKSTINGTAFRSVGGSIPGLPGESEWTEDQLENMLVANDNHTLGGCSVFFGKDSSFVNGNVWLPADAEAPVLKSAILASTLVLDDFIEKSRKWKNHSGEAVANEGEDPTRTDTNSSVASTTRGGHLNETQPKKPDVKNDNEDGNTDRSFPEKTFDAIVAAGGWILHAIKWFYQKIWTNMVRLWPKGTLGKIGASLLGIVGALPILCILRWINKKLHFTEHVEEGFWAELTKGLGSSGGGSRSRGGNRPYTPPKPATRRKEYICVYCHTVFQSRFSAAMHPCIHHPRGKWKGPHKVVGSDE